VGSPAFRGPDEFVEVIDHLFAMMSEDSELGTRLRDADTPQRFEFPDLGLAVNVRAGGAQDGGDNLVWEWGDDVGWEPKVRMTMSSETANRYFQGRENVAMAIARRRIMPTGDVRAALALIPIIKPIHERYRTYLAAEHPDLLA
jgi:hypothetical protein